MSSTREITLLLVGRTGNGKSTTGNTILSHFSPASRGAAGKFSVAHSLNSDTRICEEKDCYRGTQKITVINTPDVANVPAVGKTEKRSEKEINKEINNWALKIKEPTKAAVLLVIRCNARYSMEEYEVYKQLTQDKSFTNNLVVVFTMGGELNGRDLRTDLVDANRELLDVMDNAGWRYVVFGDVKKARDVTQAACVNTLMEIVDKMKPHSFPQQICRLLVTGKNGEPMARVKDVWCMPPSKKPNDKVQFLHKTTEDGLRLEVTVCAEEVLRKHSKAVTTALCPGPHAILSFSATPNLKTTLRKALGEQGSLKIKSSSGHMQLDVANFIVDVAGKGDLKKVLEEVKKVAWETFYMTEAMKNASDEVQTCIDNCQATYENYLKVKEKMVDELISKVA